LWWLPDFVNTWEAEKTMHRVNGYVIKENRMLSDLLGQKVETKVYTVDGRYIVESDDGHYLLVKVKDGKLLNKDSITDDRYAKLLQQRMEYNKNSGVDLNYFNNSEISTVPIKLVIGN
jgi:hypothetical protein